jgi:hypothetical protein
MPVSTRQYDRSTGRLPVADGVGASGSFEFWRRYPNMLGKYSHRSNRRTHLGQSWRLAGCNRYYPVVRQDRDQPRSIGLNSTTVLELHHRQIAGSTGNLPVRGETAARKQCADSS